MTDQERTNRAFRAKQAHEEFVAPVIDALREEYRDRIETVALNELDPAVRAGKVAALSVALKALKSIDTGLRAAIADGQEAERNIMRAREIEGLSEHKRRLLNMGPRY